MFSKKILVIEDEQDEREMLAAFFSQTGFVVKTAPSGRKALKVMDTFIPNLVLLDYMMPHITGLEIFPKLKKIFPFIKVVVLTGKGSEEIAVRALKMGLDDYITKPFNLETVRKAVIYYLQKQREEIIWLNGKYHYPMEDEFLNRYEYLRLVHSRPELGVKTASAFFTFSRQDFYNYLSRFKKWGVVGLFGERELKNLAEGYRETRLKKKKPVGFAPCPFLEKEKRGKVYRLDKFLNWKDSAQIKLEMIREAAISPKPHIGAICRKYGITREAFYQNYRAFEDRGVFGLLGRKKGRPRKTPLPVGA